MRTNKKIYPVGTERNPAENFLKLPNGTGVVKNSSGTKYWKDGNFHREDGPAIVSRGGDKEWFLNGLRHRADGPAVEYTDGSKEYWIHGEHMTEAEFIHRTKDDVPKGTAKVTDSTIIPDDFPVGSEQNPASNYGQLPDGTGLMVNGRGTKEWYKNGKRHREDGPAIEYAEGTKEYWIHGEKFSKVEFFENQQNHVRNYWDSGDPDFPLGTEQNPARNVDELPDGTGIVVNGRGSKFWYLNGALHREDGPALEVANGSKHWYKNGVLHREDGPALEVANGSKFWYLNGKLHREDGPAVEGANGSKEYWIHGEKFSKVEFFENQQNHVRNYWDLGDPDFPLGSEQNPARNVDELPDGTGLMVTELGTKFWCLNGKLHRVDGPAVEWSNGGKDWYLNGELHREDGPAIIVPGIKVAYYLHGKELSKKEFRRQQSTNPVPEVAQVSATVSTSDVSKKFLRIGDVERDSAVAELGAHYEAGRITMSEFDERSSHVLNSRTQAEIDEVFDDLPKLSQTGSGVIVAHGDSAGELNTQGTPKRVINRRTQWSFAERLLIVWLKFHIFIVLFYFIMSGVVFIGSELAGMINGTFNEIFVNSLGQLHGR